ncbi:MAG: hypothetical protein N2C12_03605 [Planctomycetales bacterium]
MALCIVFSLIFLSAMTYTFADPWQPAPGRLMTRWSKDVSPEQVHPEYPRPQMVRDQWLNLNGLWEYAIRPVDEKQQPPETYDGQILVPFPAESSLSGVMKKVGPDNALWYRREFTVPEEWTDEQIMLNFGAVDWQATVLVNGKPVGNHSGGYDPFRLDITAALVPGKQELVVVVWDPTDAGEQPRGKQVRDPKEIWYSPVTGIWQTVWLEPVNSSLHIESLKIVPDLEKGYATLTVNVAGQSAGSGVAVQVTSKSLGDEQQSIQLPRVSKPTGQPFKLFVG